MNQEKEGKFQSLVLSGGGMNAIVILGALKKLCQHPRWSRKDVINYAGSSFGAILAAIMSVGLDLSIAEKFFLEFDYKKYQSCNFDLLFTEFGIDDGIKIQQLFCTLLQKYTGIRDPTFKQLHQKYNNTLWISAVEIRKPTMVGHDQIKYWSHINSPNMPVALAIRASISIPLIFTSPTINGKYYADGCLIDNFPIIKFDPQKTIGIRITNRKNSLSEHFAIKTNKTSDHVLEESVPVTIYDFITGVWSTVYTETQRLRQNLHRYPYILTIHNAGVLSLDTTTAVKIKMIKHGETSMLEFIKKPPAGKWIDSALKIVTREFKFDLNDESKVCRVKQMIKDLLAMDNGHSGRS